MGCKNTFETIHSANPNVSILYAGMHPPEKPASCRSVVPKHLLPHHTVIHPLQPPTSWVPGSAGSPEKQQIPRRVRRIPREGAPTRLVNAPGMVGPRPAGGEAGEAIRGVGWPSCRLSRASFRLHLLPASSVQAAIRQNHPTACLVARRAMVSAFTFAVGVVVIVRKRWNVGAIMPRQKCSPYFVKTPISCGGLRCSSLSLPFYSRDGCCAVVSCKRVGVAAGPVSWVGVGCTWSGAAA